MAKQVGAKERTGCKSRRPGYKDADDQDVPGSEGTEDQDMKDTVTGSEDEGGSRGEKPVISSSSATSGSRRPKRNAAQRASAYLLEKQTTALFWREERDLKKALEASLSESRREAKKSAKTSVKQAVASPPLFAPPPPRPLPRPRPLPPPALGSNSKVGGGESVPPEPVKCQTQEQLRRPKRLSAQRPATYLMDEQSNCYWNEDRDLKKALRASLSESKKNGAKTNSEPTQSGSHSQSLNTETATNRERKLASTSSSKLNGFKAKRNRKFNKRLNPSLSGVTSNHRDNFTLSKIGITTTNGPQTGNKKPRIHSQRKFAQGASSSTPSSTPIKAEPVISVPMTEVFTRCRPTTEDFLTFLCLRGSSLLPPNLDFSSLNIKPLHEERNDKEAVSESEISNDPEMASSTSDIRKSSSLKLNDPSLGKSAQKMSTTKDTKINGKSTDKRRVLSSKSTLKANEDSRNDSLETKSSKKARNNPNLKAKVYALREKYKLQRLARKGNNSMNKPSATQSFEETLKTDTRREKGDDKPSKVYTRRGYLLTDTKEYVFEMISAKRNDDVKSKRDEKAAPLQRVLRSRPIDIPVKRPVGRPPNPVTTANGSKCDLPLKKSKTPFRPFSPLGLRTHDRKAKLKASLFDYQSDSDTDSGKSSYEKIPTQDVEKMVVNSSPTILLKRVPVVQQEDKSRDGNNGKKAGTVPIVSKRITRSSSSASSSKDEDAKEMERKIKEQILEIERKEKLKIALRRCSSDSSLHSSSSSSSTSSESLPVSDSSSSDINIPRITRSIEHLKQLRTIAKKQKPGRRREATGKSNRKLKEGLQMMPHKLTQELGNKGLSESKNVASSSGKKSLENSKLGRKRLLPSEKDRPNAESKKQSIGPKRGRKRNRQETREAYSEIGSRSSESRDIDRALQSMAEDIQSLDDSSGEDHCVPDLVYCDTGPIQGLMTSEFSGAFSAETVFTASAMLLPSSSTSSSSASGSASASSNLSASCAQTCPSLFQPADAATTCKLTADASTNTVEEDILACTSANEDKAGAKCGLESSVGTQTITPVGSPESDSGDESALKPLEEGSDSPPPTCVPVPSSSSSASGQTAGRRKQTSSKGN